MYIIVYLETIPTVYIRPEKKNYIFLFLIFLVDRRLGLRNWFLVIFNMHKVRMAKADNDVVQWNMQGLLIHRLGVQIP